MRLSDLYPTLSTVERQQLAEKAGTDAGYLWQLSTQWRGKKASLVLITRLVEADSRLGLADLVDEFTKPQAASHA